MEKKHGGKRIGAGRKPVLPAGTKQRAFRLTDEEFILVKEFIAKLRNNR